MRDIILIFTIVTSVGFVNYRDNKIPFNLQIKNYYDTVFFFFYFLPQVQSAAAGSATSESRQPHERGCGRGCCICSILSPLQTGTQSDMRWGSVKLQHIIMEFCV